MTHSCKFRTAGTCILLSEFVSVFFSLSPLIDCYVHKLMGKSTNRPFTICLKKKCPHEGQNNDKNSFM